MADSKKISIVVPVYKVEKELDRCVQSLLNQTYKDIEIILVDDGSPDRCPILCEQYAIENDKVKVVHKKNGGLSDARNVGLKNATGKYILYVDSDDYIDLDSCERFIRATNNQEIDIIVGNAIVEKKDGIEKMIHSATPSGVIYNAREFVVKAIVSNEWYAPAWLNMYSRKFLLNNDLYFKKGIYFEDVQMLPRVFLKSNTITCLDGTFYHYIIRENSIMTSNSSDVKTKDSIDIYQEWYSLFEKIEDKEFQRYLYGVLVKYYISNCKVRGIKGFVIDGLDYSFCIDNALNVKEKIKVFLFGKMPLIYAILAKIFS